VRGKAPPDDHSYGNIWLMRVASEADAAARVVVDVAGRARGRMRAFQQGKFRVGEIVGIQVRTFRNLLHRQPNR
jgi:hypothetical protein